MAVVDIAARSTVEEIAPRRFPAHIIVENLFVAGGKNRKPYQPVQGRVWHIIGATVDRWSNGSPVPLCSGFVGWHGRNAEPAQHIHLRWDRICKTCVRTAEARARARGVH